MTVSIKDVAKKAGVSVSTVSRALNGYTDVSEKTKRKIQDTVRDLGYVPNESAKNLSSKTSRNLALIVLDIYEDDKMDGFTGNILRGIYRYVNEQGNTLATYGVGSDMQDDTSLESLCNSYSVIGIVLLGINVHDEYFRQANKLSIPCVSVDILLSGDNNVTVTTDDEAAFEEITDYVIEQGHEKIALLTGLKEAEVTDKRNKGFIKSVAKHGLDQSEMDVLECDFLEENAFNIVKAYVEKYGKTRATAFMCMSDLMALGACRAIEKCGYKVPEDFSLTGFDGIQALNYITPGITTVNQNIKEKGYEAIKVLNDLVDDKEVSRTVYVPYKLDIRDSVKKLK